MMKRFIALLMATMMLFAVGCSEDANKDPDKDANAETEQNQNVVNNEKGYYTADDYLADPSLFVPNWSDRREVKAEMLDFEEKYQQFMTPNGRLMTVAHRGDNKNYPENSLECFMSAFLLGADVVEVDVALTKDGVLVVLHDDTLQRTTNVDILRMQGVAGFPESNYVSDWTLDQLRRLRLLSPDGSSVTSYVIPTLEDVIRVCNENCFITLDKESRFEWYNDIIPLIEKHNAWRTVMLPYSYSHSQSPQRVKQHMDYIKEKSGYVSALMFRASDTKKLEGSAGYIEEYGFPKVLRCGEYGTEEPSLFFPYNAKYRVHIECLHGNDYLEGWQKIHSEGFGIIVTNDIEGLTGYVQDTYFNK